MKDTSKLLLTVAVGAIMLGLGLSQHISPAMNQASGPDWRERYRAAYSDTSMQYVDAGPIDLTPSLSWPGGPFGRQAMMQAPLDHGSDYGAEYYSATELAMAGDGTEDFASDPPYEPAPPARPVQQAVQAAAATAEMLDRTADDRPGDLSSSANRIVSPNNFGSAGTLPAIGAPTPL